MIFKTLHKTLASWLAGDCRLCGDPDSDQFGLCQACLHELPRNLPACPRCGAAMTNTASLLCGQCLQHPPHFDQAIVPYRYAPPLNGFVTGLKFHGQLAAARLLAGLLQQTLSENLEKGIYELPECVVPVPLHPGRLRTRGFNQAVELSRPVARQLQLPLEIHGVRRQRNTRPQSELQRQARQRNIRHAFKVRDNFQYKHIALVDDVITTGSTVNELARVFKKAGVRRVDVWAVARA